MLGARTPIPEDSDESGLLVAVVSFVEDAHRFIALSNSSSILFISLLSEKNRTKEEEEKKVNEHSCTAMMSYDRAMHTKGAHSV